MSEFRIKLNLSNFFKDVRASSFILKSHEIVTINDLQKHISNLFKITEDLILLCDDYFLPGEESVKIIKENDVVTVIEGGVRRVKKVKKRKFKEDESLCEVDLTSNINRKNELEINFIEPETSNKQKKKKLKEKPAVVEVIEEEKRESDCKKKKNGLTELGKLENSFTEDVALSNPKEKYEFSGNKNRIVSHRKIVEPMPISTVAKVIKSVKVSDDSGWHFPPTFEKTDSFVEEVHKPLAVPLPEEKHMDIDETEQPMIPKTENKKIIIHSNEKLISSFKNDTLQSDSDVESVLESESVNSSISIATGKRKRKRYRKRKSKAVEPEIAIQPVPVPVFKTNYNVKNVHIKFDDDLNPHVISEPAVPLCESVKEAVSLCEPAVIEFGEKEDVPVDESISLVVNTAVCGNEISSYPMEIKPKVNDKIAFKKYVLGDDYTPKISDFVIAQVCDFDVETQEMVLDILKGGEQCAEPRGKFSLIDAEKEEEQIVNRIQMNLSEMIAPRLIY